MINVHIRQEIDMIRRPAIFFSLFNEVDIISFVLVKRMELNL
jgi:hypothetical protein